jgi:riboflavin biosynthesis pyrimidine reductase
VIRLRFGGLLKRKAEAVIQRPEEKRPGPSASQLSTLWEKPNLPAFDLPAPLRDAYGGVLGFELPTLYANFVASLDGVVAFEDQTPPSAISGGSRADRFVMGLLRACADTVVIGASTLRTEPKHLWHPEKAFGELAESFSALRRDLRLPESPQLVVLTQSGDLDPSIRALQAGALVITTDSGKSNLKGKLPAATAVVSRGPEVRVSEVIEVLRREGCRSILSEGGPHLMGKLLEAEVVAELFMTLAPVLAGRESEDRRLGLVEGFAFHPVGLKEANLLSVKQEGSQLFLRYGLPTADRG